VVRLLRFLLWGLARWVLPLRYRVQVQELEHLDGMKRPVLILPNHPAYIEPAIVFAALWPTLKPRPLVFETMFRNWLL
jgi:long-chain-fatty-acid--[acyl-carrier-protein] ligase